MELYLQIIMQSVQICSVMSGGYKKEKYYINNMYYILAVHDIPFTLPCCSSAVYTPWPCCPRSSPSHSVLPRGAVTPSGSRALPPAGRSAPGGQYTGNVYRHGNALH